MKKHSYVGIADKIRLVSSFPDLLVRFTLHNRNEPINCLVAKRELANLILFLEDNTFELSVFGHFNSRKQLVIEKFIVRNPNSFIRKFVLQPLKNIA
ncbi:hypothetical protein IW492_07145 [Enterococcus sp. BWB1-3]|uniref:hypothetical protein n=1 Tax=unclassified Enterococcus TaxID=2608891 RepID=UPI001924D0FC|nr:MULTISPECIES: hypothetical protein [unclassified Enterococcus]MBL1229008.1 hypothetical protein [Enterococcus sp. BWB1-3]MCB5952277.1 hypothetical protein [Enterococcus sp. BWT-B8]MCB5955494.1 hypothetical protein [Enterococcus sp. CWB-B31]